MDQSLLYGPAKAKEKDVVLVCTVAGDPCSKARARWVPKTGAVYTPEATRVRQAGIAMIARASHRELVVDPVALFSLRAGFYLGTNQARDVDNMLKLVSDALKGIVWEDDRQVAEMFGFKVPAERAAEARTEIVVLRLPGRMPYTFAHCRICQRPFRIYPSWKFKECCSRRCWGLSIRTRQRVPCTQCGKIIEVAPNRLSARWNYCSRTCKGLASRGPVSQRTGICQKCGGPVTRLEYALCWACHTQQIRRGGRGVEITVEAL